MRVESRDDIAALERLTRMKKFPLAFLFLVAACGSEDDPELTAPVTSADTDTKPAGTETQPGDTEASGPVIPPQEGALLPLEWASTDFGQATYLNVGQLDFGSDDSLVVGSTIDDRSTNLYAPRGRIDRFTADGALLWTVELGFDEFAGDIPVPEESDTIQIDGKAVHLASIDHTADGQILVAFNVVLDYFDYESDVGINYTTRSYIRSYDLDGNVVCTSPLGGVTDFPARDSVDELAGVNGIRALSDGSIVWSGDTTRGQHPFDHWTLVTEGSLGRLSADGTPLWTVVLGQELDMPNMIAPAEEIAMDVQPTADGGLAVRGHFHGTLTIGDLSATSTDRSTFVARLDLDGTPTWLATVLDSEPISGWFAFPGMGIDSAGNLFTASYIFAEDTTHLIQVSPSGEILTQVALGDVETLAVSADDHIVVGGSTLIELGDDQYAWPGRVEVRQPDGTIVASRLFATADPQPDESSRAFAVATSPSGRIAVGGTFDAAIDLGAGTVTSTPGVDISAYVAVYSDSCGAGHD